MNWLRGRRLYNWKRRVVKRQKAQRKADRKSQANERKLAMNQTFIPINYNTTR